ncbi:MAG: flagellar protein export ATPase FliI [Sphingobacteriia bacterium]|nr:flagellar protein export ATPase FliI [Sphingobacteriia bacterium]NCC41144.1 flagellar protein export ATPase FliI [Gammaproteobacteria bacterium]
MNELTQNWCRYLSDHRERVGATNPIEVAGRLVRVNGLVLEASGLRLALGSACRILLNQGGEVEAEVVGFNGDRIFMMPTNNMVGLTPGARVLAADTPPPRPVLGQPLAPHRRASDHAKHLPVGDALLGRVLDGNGRPLDGLGPLEQTPTRSLQSRPLNPLARTPISEPLGVGIRAIDALLTVGRGQRLGLFAGSGVGKSVLIGMMARYTSADVIVVGLIGERGREVKEFIQLNLGQDGLQRAVVIAAPADTSPLMRLQGAAYAATVAEHFRDQGRHVLLIMDSLTRYAMAQREIALAIGEPPVTRGYPPSAFARLPELVERAGNGLAGGGSITAFYTVLVEGDDQQEPIADAARAILDGHIVLSRTLADQGHYPAIDIEQSISRAMHTLVDNAQQARIRQFKQLFSRYERSRDLIAVGAYQPGNDPVLDAAVNLYPRMEAFLQQGIDEFESVAGAREKLAEVFSRS